MEARAPLRQRVWLRSDGRCTREGVLERRRLFVAGEGDVIDRHYKIIKVEQNSLDVEDRLEQTTLTIALPG